MKDYQDVLNELMYEKNDEGEVIKEGLSFDQLRGKYLKKISDITGRNVISYYSSFLQRGGCYTSIDDDDIIGFSSLISNMDASKGLDLILNTPGGNPSAAEGIVKYLHNVFGNDIRVIIPQNAYSAGTMIACSAKTILMTNHSFLGPTDPQINVGNGYIIPAYNIIDEYNDARNELEKNPKKKTYWKLVLSKYPPAFDFKAWDDINITRESVNEFLEKYMFADEKNKKKIEESVERITYSLIHPVQSHSKHFDIDDCREMGLKVESLDEENNKELNEAIMCLHYAYMITFDYTNIEKFIENQYGKMYYKGSYDQSDDDEDDDED